jgi:hypothetical protein
LFEFVPLLSTHREVDLQLVVVVVFGLCHLDLNRDSDFKRMRHRHA